MAYDYEDKKKKQISSMRAITDYGMGIFFSILGLVFLFHEQLGIDFSRFSKTSFIDVIFGIISLLYGLWRIYRGYNKNYFK
ncbi:MAG: hypothetical protein H0V30_12060 [Chitinophagaceae bacterium]|jgi:hypothetical protein|nr:hypothetical protein [Chitinophagaceae bacterium]